MSLPHHALFALLLLVPAASPAPVSAATLAQDTVPGERPSAPMVQPGAPGESTRSVGADEMSGLGGAAYTRADVRFMRGMIPHHAQALEMTALAERHATTEAVRRMALRMEISQRDEIGLMARWLRERGEEVPDWDEAVEKGVALAMVERGESLMPGMLSPEEMNALSDARGVEFDRLFLRLMIEHHRGAVVMVRNLFDDPAAGQEAAIFRFASHVDADQTAEIARMRRVLEGLR